MLPGRPPHASRELFLPQSAPQIQGILECLGLEACHIPLTSRGSYTDFQGFLPPHAAQGALPLPGCSMEPGNPGTARLGRDLKALHVPPCPDQVPPTSRDSYTTFQGLHQFTGIPSSPCFPRSPSSPRLLHGTRESWNVLAWMGP